MANRRIQGIMVKIGGDTTELGQALESVENTSRGLRSELREVNYSLKNNSDSVVLWEQKQELLSKAIEESRKKVKTLEEAQDQIKEKYLSGEIDDGQYRAFQRELENARAEAKRFGSQLEEAENKVNELKGTSDKTGESTSNLGDDLQNAGKEAQNSADGGFTVLKGAIADLASDAIKAAVDGFKELASEGEEALNTIQTRTGATAEEMEQYSSVMSNLYANNFGEDKADLAESISSVKQQLGELSPEELEKITERAILMRDTFGYDVAESIRTVKMLMDQFEVSADEAYTLIAQGSQKGLDKNGDLLDTLNEYSVHYKSMGYSAEEFFNSLQNGTAAGTFSVDKLGDAVKEFNIRQKEGADETVAAWTALGLVQADSSESINKMTDRIAEQRDKIGQLEKKLKYAYIEQSNFNSETDELKKMKMADNIAEWEQELSELQGSLAVNENSLRSMQTAGNDAKYTAEELMTAFNSGRDEAKEATEDVINALFALEDETLKNQFGVQLFGTMWEDLGKDGVSALMDVSGEADKTASTLDDINKVKYDDAGNQFEKLKRKMITEILEPAAKNLIPKIEDGTEWLVDNLPDILETGKKLLPVVTGVGTAFTAWKISKSVTSFLSGNPFGVFAAGAGLAATAIDYFSDKVKDGKSETEKFIEEQEEYQKKCRESIEEIKNLKEEADKNAAKINLEFGDTESKWRELQELVDQNGVIKQGYEDRVNYIVGELTDATGVEIELVDGQIQKYNELKDTIEKTIDKQRAQRLFEVYSANEAELYTKQAEAQQEYYDTKGVFDEKKLQYRNKKSDLDAKIREQWELKKNDDEWGNGTFEDYEKFIRSNALAGNFNFTDNVGIRDAWIDYQNAINERTAAKKSFNEAVSKYNASTSELDRLMQAENLIAEEEYDKATRLLTAHNDEYKKVVEDKNKTDEERREAYKESLDKMNSDLDLANSAAEQGYKESAEKQIQTVADAFAENVDIALESGVKSADVFDENFKSTFKKLLQNGADVSAINDILKKHGVTWGDATGLSLVEQLELTISGKGPALADVLSGSVRGAVDAINEDPPVVTVAVKPDLWELNEFISGFGGSFSGSVSSLISNLPKFAAGGFLGSGQGIVAEAGPELIEIMNGGAKITPLTGTARNTPVTSGNSGRVVYINNTINAQISGKYGVRHLAEDLAGEQRRIERNLGL